jgi:hypothetical protein
MKKIIILVIGVCIYAHTTIAQSTRYFEHILGQPNSENTMTVLQLQNGSYITLGLRGIGNTGLSNADFIKTDIYGNSTLDTIYTDTITYSIFYDAFLENDTTIVIAGYGQNSTENMWLLKTDTSGNIRMSSFIGDSVLATRAFCIKKTMDGGYILGGTTDTNPEKGCIIKADSNGHKVWERIFPATTFKNAIASVVLTTDSGFVFTGGYNYFVDTGEVWVVKLDKNGITVKDTTYDFSTGNIGVSIGLSNDGGYIIGGQNAGSVGLLIKIDSNYVVHWRRNVLNSQNTLIVAAFEKIIVLSDESIVGCGFAGGFSDFITKFDSSGNELWIRFYKLSSSGYNDYAYSLDTTSDGGFIMCGRTECNGCSAVPFIKTNCLGFVAPPTAAFTDSLGIGYDVKFWNQSQNTDTCYWNWGDSTGLQMIRLDTTPIVHTYSHSGSYNVTLIAIACGEIDSIAITTPLITTVNVSNSDVNEKQVFIYPNPNNGEFTLSYNLTSSNSEFIIKDITGRVVYKQNINGLSGKRIIDVFDLSNDIYFYQLSNDQETVRGKFVKE